MMRLSEAIRLGALMKPQRFGYANKDGKTCAAGAAYDAIDLDFNEQTPEAWKWVGQVLRYCPHPNCNAYGHDRPKVVQYILSLCLNDGHRWTRERIAVWIESVEQELELVDKQEKVKTYDICQ